MRSVKKLLPATLATALAAVVAAGFVLGSSALHASPARPTPLRAQTPAQPQDSQQGPVIRSQVTLVNLFATVRDHNKRIVTDLKQQDFKIQEDGQDQQIAFFSREVTLPITLALLLDTSGSEQFMLGAIQDMGGQFLGRVLRKGDEALIMSFDTDVDLLADWTDDRGLLDRAIRKTRINAPMGGGMINPGPVGGNTVGTAFYDAVYLACNEKLTGEAGRKAIVIVTDAQDEGSKVRKEEAIEAAQRTDTVIHILLVADSRFGGNTSVAKQMTEETGGRMIVANNEKHLQEAFDQISEELRSQYTLGYYPTNTARDGKFRKIKVEVSQHDDKVLARKGYYAPKG
jgi:VWFA-related protein